MEVRDQLETDIKALNAEEILTHKSKTQEEAIAHQREIAAIQKEVAERLPKLSAQAAEKVEKQYQEKLMNEVAAIKHRHELSEDEFKRELLELQASFAEKARARVATTDERADLERLKGQNTRLKQQVEAGVPIGRSAQCHESQGSRTLLQADKERYLQAIDQDRAAVPVQVFPHSHQLASNNSLDRDESAAQDMAVRELQLQLNVMKSQLGSALERTVNNTARANSVPFSVTKSAYNSTRPSQRVTFSLRKSLYVTPRLSLSLPCPLLVQQDPTSPSFVSLVAPMTTAWQGRPRRRISTTCHLQVQITLAL